MASLMRFFVKMKRPQGYYFSGLFNVWSSTAMAAFVLALQPISVIASNITCIGSSSTATDPHNIGVGSICYELNAPIGSSGSIINSGSIVGNDYPSTGIANAGNLSSIQNNASVYGYDTGIRNGAVRGDPVWWSWYTSPNASIYEIINGSALNSTATISGDKGIQNQAVIGTISGNVVGGGITNYGTILGYNGDHGYAGIVNYGNGDNYGFISQISNESTGLITDGGHGQYGILNYGGAIGSITPSGSTLGGIINSGTISGTQFAISNEAQGTIASVSNSTSGLIAGGVVGVFNYGGTIGSVFNSGHITGDYAIDNTSIINSISNERIGRVNGNLYGVYNQSSGSIGTLSNLGVITGGNNDIYNSGSITTLINAQGGNLEFGGAPKDGSFSAEATALTITGNVPENYQAYLISESHYGQLSANNVTGTMDFSVAVDPNYHPTTGTIYYSVLTGIGADQIGGSISRSLTSCGSISAYCFQGSSNGYTWDLYQENSAGTYLMTWDLLITGVMAAPELDGSLVPRALLLMFIAYLLSGGTWPLTARQRADE